MQTHIHPARRWFVVRLSPHFAVKGSSDQRPSPTRDCQVPRAPLHTTGITHRAANVSRHVGGRYPSFFAHTDPCARPNPSRRLQFPLPTSLCRLLSAPAGRWPFPVLSLQSLLRCLDPYPAALLRCFCPFLPGEHRSHPTETGSDATEQWPIRNFNDPEISGLQSFANVQAPALAKAP